MPLAWKKLHAPPRFGASWKIWILERAILFLCLELLAKELEPMPLLRQSHSKLVRTASSYSKHRQCWDWGKFRASLLISLLELYLDYFICLMRTPCDKVLDVLNVVTFPNMTRKFCIKLVEKGRSPLVKRQRSCRFERNRNVSFVIFFRQ